MTDPKSTQELIDALIEHWRFWHRTSDHYLMEIAKSLVSDSSNAEPVEKDLLAKLKKLLNEREWNALPQFVGKRCRGIPVETERERLCREEEVWAKARRDSLFPILRDRFISDYLAAEKFYKDECSVVISEDEFQSEKIKFVQSWLAKNAGGKAEYNADDEQLAAISTVNGHVQVIARAGSGKTTTLVYRAFFLIKHCGVSPGEMLLLAFNRKAALEMRRRLLALFDPTAESAVVGEIKRRHSDQSNSRTLNRRDSIEAQSVEAIAEERNIQLPHVMTFHALAYAIVHPEEPILYDDSEGGGQALSQVFQFVVDDHLQMSPHREKIRELMLAHFREDWDRIVEGCYDKSKEELLRFRRSLPTESLGGDYVKSWGEKVIADFLFEHDVSYKYERNHLWSGINYRPDFTIFKTPKSGLIIEYFGLKGDADYDEMSEDKRRYWKAKRDWSLVEFSPRDIAEGTLESFRARLRHELEANDIRCDPLSEDEIWHRVRERAIDRFTTAMVGFVGRCRKKSLTPSDLRALIDRDTPLSSVEGMFLELGDTLYAAYLERLAATGEEDFDGLMQRAADLVNADRVLFERKTGRGDLSKLRHIFIDEFQDFSDLFYRLLAAIFKVNPSVELFCVGDDWQAINGFAGSELRFFENFEKYVGDARRLYLSKNYRSHRAIVSIGNALMDGFGVKAQANRSESGSVWLSDLEEFEPYNTETERHPGDAITPAVLRVVNKALADGLDVVMLCRRNVLPWFVNYQESDISRGRGLDRYVELIRSYFPKGLKERITISTAHKYKGLERKMVIVLDAVARSYPLIHPDWVFSRILGDSLDTITSEERRLFYVALTRASDCLVIFTDKRRISPFLEDIQHKEVIPTLAWDEIPPARPVEGAMSRLVVKIGNQDRRGSDPTFAIKDCLKATGYEWENRGWPAWTKSYPSEGFAVNILKLEVWAADADGIEVRIFDDTASMIARYSIDAGRWKAVPPHGAADYDY